MQIWVVGEKSRKRSAIHFKDSLILKVPSACNVPTSPFLMIQYSSLVKLVSVGVGAEVGGEGAGNERTRITPSTPGHRWWCKERRRKRCFFFSKC